VSAWILVLAVQFGGAPEPEPGAEPDVVAESPQDPEPPPVVIHPPVFPEPQRIRGRDRSSEEVPPERFTARPPLIRPALRVAPGFSGRLTGRPYAAFRLDVLASVLFGLQPGRHQFGLAPEFGYSLRVPSAEHDLLAGIGVVHGINAEGRTLGWLPRFVAQPGPDGLGMGVRNGLWWDFAENGFSVEVSHQWVRRGSVDTHDLQVSVGLDVLMLIVVLSKARMAWS
jgi:hypothetical protein